MKVRVDDPWIAGKAIVGEPGLGILGSAVPDGSLLSNDTGIDADKHYRYLITSVSPGLSFFLFEDTSFIASANDGTYYVESETYEDGQIYGTKTTTLTFGASGTAVTGTLAATLDGVTMAASGQIVVPGLFAATLDGVSMSASGTVAEHVEGQFAATLGDVRMRALGYLGDTPPSGGFWRRLSIGLGIGL